VVLKPTYFDTSDIIGWAKPMLQLLWRENAILALWVIAISGLGKFAENYATYATLVIYGFGIHGIYAILHHADVRCGWNNIFYIIRKSLSNNISLYVISLIVGCLIAITPNNGDPFSYEKSFQIFSMYFVGLHLFSCWLLPLICMDIPLKYATTMTNQSVILSIKGHIVISMIGFLLMIAIIMTPPSWFVGILILPFSGLMYVGMRKVFFDIGENQEETVSTLSPQGNI